MLPFDREGRVLLPELIRKKAQLENDALFVEWEENLEFGNRPLLIAMRVKQENF